MKAVTVKKIDKQLPAKTGDLQKDIDGIRNYIIYMREQINFALNSIDKRGGKSDG